MNYIRLPAGPAPKTLTARAPTRNLREHFLVFLAKNNPNGYPIDESATDTLMDLVNEIESMASISSGRIRAAAREIAEDLQPYRITHRQCLDIVARIVGYKDYPELLRMAKKGGNNRVLVCKYVNFALFDSPEDDAKQREIWAEMARQRTAAALEQSKMFEEVKP